MDNLNARLEAEAKALQTRDEKAREEAFAVLMSNPLIRMLLADIPSSDGKLDGILKEVFRAGWNGGGAQMMVEVVRRVSR